MTRVNLVNVTILADQHLMAEWREIKMIPAALRKSIRARGVKGAFGMMPVEFCLNRGHISFFYDKMLFLRGRYRQITDELISRGYNLYHTGDYSDFLFDIPLRFRTRIWEPSRAEVSVSAERIVERLDMKRHWYRFYGNSLPDVVYSKVARLVV